MTQAFRQFVVVLSVVLIFAACNRMEPIYNVETDAAPSDAQQKLSSEQVGKIITKTAIEKGWTVHEVKPGLLHCMIAWKEHSATVDISYSRKSYSITLDSSQNLKEADGMIHKKYNEYVQQLQTEIDEKLSQVTYN